MENKHVKYKKNPESHVKEEVKPRYFVHFFRSLTGLKACNVSDAWSQCGCDNYRQPDYYKFGVCWKCGHLMRSHIRY